jgi:hypothetical protein
MEVSVKDILDIVTKYSPPVVLLLALVGIFIFVSKQVTENVITANFERYKKDVDLRLQRRSNFEERVLLDRYTLLRDIHTKIGKVTTDLNRVKSGSTVKGLEVNGELVPLTEVGDLIERNRYLITERFRDILLSQCQLELEYANTKDPTIIKKQVAEYLELELAFDKAMNEVFGLDKITWNIRE